MAPLTDLVSGGASTVRAGRVAHPYRSFGLDSTPHSDLSRFAATQNPTFMPLTVKATKCPRTETENTEGEA